MDTNRIEESAGRSLFRYFVVLFGLCLPLWTIGAAYDVQLFPGFKLFQAGLAMPMVAALIVSYQERGKAGIVALLRRTYDVRKIKPRIWLLPIFLVYPSLGLVNYLVVRLSGAAIPPPTFSLVGFLGWIYNNSGRSLFSMALCHWTFGLFWSFWPQDNLQKAVPFYWPQIAAAAAVVYVLVVVYLWGPKTLARFRFARATPAI